MLLDPRVVEYGATRLASGCKKYELKLELQSMFGNDAVINNQFEYEAYLTACFKKINEYCTISPKDIANRIQTFLWSVMGDLDESTRYKIAAAREMRKLFGLSRIEQGAEEQGKEIRDFLNRTDELSIQEKIRESRGTFRD